MMLRLASYDIVFTEIPGEVTLALNLSQCPNRCPGCHSAHLQSAVGEPLDEVLLDGLLATYGGSVSCVCLMGGDGDPAEVQRLAGRIREKGLKSAWYSGRDSLPSLIDLRAFDFIKLGAWVEALGGLDREGTNQRLYRIDEGKMVDITSKFRKP